LTERDTKGHPRLKLKAPESPSEDENEEARSEGEQLVEQGVAAAEHDQMLQAAGESAKEDERKS
jgi:hypothetical protein